MQVQRKTTGSFIQGSGSEIEILIGINWIRIRNAFDVFEHGCVRWIEESAWTLFQTNIPDWEKPRQI
jgi:hypothetical protein